MWGRELLYAAQEGNLDIVKQYVETGAEINYRSYAGWTPLMKASELGYYSVVKYLLESGARVDLRNSNGTSALILACRSKHQSMVSLLLDYDADPSFVSTTLGTAEFHALRHGWNFDQMKIQSYYISPFYFDHLFCCAIEENVNKSKKRKREGAMEMKEPEKTFIAKFMAKVIFADLIFVHRVLPYLFGPYDA